jgi:small-conductance mechanosensitive channel
MTDIWPAFWPVLAFAVATAAALVARAIVLVGLKRWPGAGPSSVVAAAIRGPSVFWCLAIGLYIATDIALDRALLPGLWHVRIGMVLQAILVLSGTFALAAIVAHAVGHVSERGALGAGVTGLAQTTSRAVVFSVGLLVLLSAFGVQITPVLTALGVGGLAVALALQDTLANLFAGVHLLADKPIRVGDYVKVGDAGEGFVVDIGWRSTRIRSLGNNIIIAPNQTVAKATITNYSQPDARLSFGLKVCVDYSADADRVETMLRDEVTRAVDEVPGLLREPAPDVSLIPGFGEYALEFGVGYSVASFVKQYPVQHELRKRILHRFRREGIAIAIPARNVRVWQDAMRADAGAQDRRDAAATPGGHGHGQNEAGHAG